MIDGLECIYRAALEISPDYAELFNSRAFTSDVCEGYFASIRQRHGYKPDQGQLEGGLNNAAFIDQQMSLPFDERDFSIPRRNKKQWYMSHGPEAKQRDCATSIVNAAQSIQTYLSKLLKPTHQVCKTKPTPIRAMHKYGQARKAGAAKMAALLGESDFAPVPKAAEPQPMPDAAPNPPQDAQPSTAVPVHMTSPPSSGHVQEAPAASLPAEVPAQPEQQTDPLQDSNAQIPDKLPVYVAASSSPAEISHMTVDIAKLIQHKLAGGSISKLPLVQHGCDGGPSMLTLAAFERLKKERSKKWRDSIRLEDETNRKLGD